MTFQCDVVVVGAGPVGLTTACSIKSLNPNTRVVVLDKNTTPHRNHKLLVDADSISKTQELFKNAIEHCSADSEKVESFNQLMQEWSSCPTDTGKLIQNLTEKAKELGVLVCRGLEFEVKQKEVDSLFEGNRNTTFLQKVFKAAQVIIGTDGADSTIRKSVMNNQLTDQKPMGHWVELSYQTDKEQPVTLHIAIDPETFKDLQCGNGHWTLEEIEIKGKTYARAKKVYDRCKSYFNNLKARNETFHNIKISTRKIGIFRSESCLKTYKGKHVFLVGDAESRVVLERGFSKGLQSAAVCAYLVNAYLSTGKLDPTLFQEYKDTMKDIFDIANGWAQPEEPPLPSNNCVLL